MDDQMYDRVRGLVPPQTRQLRVLVCGAGMVGSWAVAALARMCAKVLVCDFDTVAPVNLGVQLYGPTQVGLGKAEATSLLNLGFNVEYDNRPMEEVVPEVINSYDVVVCGVDTMAGRKWLAEQCVNTDVGLFTDTRLLGEMVCVLCFYDKDTYDKYISTIQPDEAIEQPPCGAEGTVYSGMYAASRIACTVNNWARGIEPPTMEVWNVALMELLNRTRGGDIDQANEEEGGSSVNFQGQADYPWEGEADDYDEEPGDAHAGYQEDDGEPEAEDTSDADWQAEEAAREALITEADQREAQAFDNLSVRDEGELEGFLTTPN